MTTTPDGSDGSQEPSDPYAPQNPYGSGDPYGTPNPYGAPGPASSRPHQAPLTPYNPPNDAPVPPEGGEGWTPPSGSAPSSPPPYGTPTSSGTPGPYGAPAPYATPDPYGSPAGPYGPGAGAYPSPGYASAYTPPVPNNGLAVASMIVSLVGLVLCGYPSIVGMILGIVAAMQISRNKQKGMGFAITGITVGALGVIFALLLTIGLIVD